MPVAPTLPTTHPQAPGLQRLPVFHRHPYHPRYGGPCWPARGRSGRPAAARAGLHSAGWPRLLGPAGPGGPAPAPLPAGRTPPSRAAPPPPPLLSAAARRGPCRRHVQLLDGRQLAARPSLPHLREYSPWQPALRCHAAAGMPGGSLPARGATPGSAPARGAARGQGPVPVQLFPCSRASPAPGRAASHARLPSARFTDSSTSCSVLPVRGTVRLLNESDNGLPAPQHGLLPGQAHAGAPTLCRCTTQPSPRRPHR